MNPIVKRAAGWVARKADSFAGTNQVVANISLRDRIDPLLSRRFFGGDNRTLGGRPINDETSMQVSAVWACVRVLAETVGSLPWAVFDQRTGERADDHPVAAVLRSPNENMDGQQLREAKTTNLALRGNAYSVVQRDGKGYPTSLRPQISALTVPMRRPNGTIFYRCNEFGVITDYEAADVWHVKGFGTNGLVGLSPIAAHAQSIGLSMTMEEFQSHFYMNGARISGTVEIPQWLSDEERPKAKKALEDKYTGLENAGKLMLLEGGMKFNQMSVPPNEAQFLESKQYSVTDIARIFRMPPHLIQDLSNATFSNIEQQSLDFVQFTLLPWLVRFEQTASKRLFPSTENGRFFLRFNVEGLLRADSAARAALYSVMLQNGVLSRNEVRGLENRPPSSDEGMNDHTVQTNMTVIQMLEAMNRAQGAKQ